MTIIDAAQWTSFAGRFTREHDGWSASIQSRQRDGDLEIAVDDLPFRGVTFESRAGHEALILMFGYDAEEHLTHIFAKPHELSVSSVGEGQCSLTIGLSDGSGYVLALDDPLLPDRG